METPCIDVCTMDQASGLCTGCLRTMAEIAAWAGMTAAERGCIMVDLPLRRRHARIRDGRAAR